MNTATRATLGLAAAALAVTGVAGSGAAAPEKGTSHTLKLTAHQTATHNIPPNKFLGTDKDLDPKTGRVVGYDTISGSFNAKTGVVKIDVAVALGGGLITAHLHGKGQSNVLDGVITGGTGKYKGIKGTIHTSGGKITHITFTYTL